MDSERFDGLVRSFGQTRSRRQTLRGLAGAGVFVALLAAKPVAAGKAGKPNKAPKNSGKGQPGNSPPGSGQNGGGGLGAVGPSQDQDCENQCLQASGLCRVRCQSAAGCEEACDIEMDQCEERCPFS